MQATLSRQTPRAIAFCPNAYAGAQINIFHDNGTRATFILSPVPFSLSDATACAGRISVTGQHQPRVTIDGKPHDRFSIIYPKNTRKRFSRT